MVSPIPERHFTNILINHKHYKCNNHRTVGPQTSFLHVATVIVSMPLETAAACSAHVAQELMGIFIQADENLGAASYL